ncbi:hypothetical protein ScPMuIL_001539 [Solemya velum]
MAEPVPELHVKTDTNQFTLRGRPCELSAYSFIPTNRGDPANRTFYNTPDTFVNFSGSTYDRLFRKELSYNNKLHRDDREHAKSRGLTVNKEEKGKTVPSLASSEYGHRLKRFIDKPDRQHVRIGHVRSEFYRRTGITC